MKLGSFGQQHPLSKKKEKKNMGEKLAKMKKNRELNF